MTADILTQSIHEGIFGEGCKLVETHISWVVLGKEKVWKFKKPLKFSFLDFSTLESRKKYCEREVDLNQRLAGEVYEAAVPVWQVEGLASLEGQGPPADFAVRMKRLDTALEMDKMLERNQVNTSHMQALGRLLAGFHGRAQRMPMNENGGWRKYWEDFADINSIQSWVEEEGSTTDQARLSSGLNMALHFLQTHAEVLEDRMANGWIRDVHGDLHAGNIFLYPEPIVFDCIEFNDHFRQIDILNELAFLCMDLDVRGHSELKKVFLNSYQEVFPLLQSGNEWALFHFFKAYRANIRAKVTALKAMQSEGEKRQAACREALHYLEWMHHYLEGLHAVL